MLSRLFARVFPRLSERRARAFVRAPSDPVRLCEVYASQGCAHVDGFLCNLADCSTRKNFLSVERDVSDPDGCQATKGIGSTKRETIHLQPQKQPQIKTAYEVYARGQGYHRRQVLQIFWSEAEANEFVAPYNQKYKRVVLNRIHVIQIGQAWHRYYVSPLHIK